ncbi:DNA-directed RNA polymerase III, subunit Rpc31 [Lentinula detonsa]|uniref:DNA-directed RNA polymerase III subunit n=1 Tax=Lentinula detonsa TaxID=2804962 RepID=A0AA38UXR9_9AGAR|nr:DNA-directed RNA polymerase III, subunit Rpc31 [Lentinula detonsa]
MSGRGGRGGGGRGRGRGFGAGALPPMGLSFADIQAMSREATALYPPMRPPIMTEPTEKEKRIAQLQIGFACRLRKSEYYVVESTKSTELPRYSDKYRSSAASQPTLKRSDLHAPFFPTEIFEAYFNPRKKAKARKQVDQKRKLNLDEMLDDNEANESAQEGSDAGGSQGDPDYDTEEEYDNDYADNYFDNGEGENFDDLGDGGGGDDGGGGGDYD